MATRRTEITNSTVFPISVHTWTISREGHRLVAESSSKAGSGLPGEKWSFPFREGALFLVNFTGNKYAYFRNAAFQAVLDKYRITAVKKGDPNRTYNVWDHCSGDGRAGYKIFTDGKVEVERIGGKWDDYEGTLGNACHDSRYFLHVTGATWVILFERCDVRDNHSSAAVLHTLGRVESLNFSSTLPELVIDDELQRTVRGLGFSGVEIDPLAGWGDVRYDQGKRAIVCSLFATPKKVLDLAKMAVPRLAPSA